MHKMCTQSSKTRALNRAALSKVNAWLDPKCVHLYLKIIIDIYFNKIIKMRCLWFLWYASCGKWWWYKFVNWWIWSFIPPPHAPVCPLRWSFGIRSAVLYGLLHPHCSQSSVRLPKPPVPPSTHLLHARLGPCSCPMTPHLLLLFRPDTPTAACIPHSNSLHEPEAHSQTALSSTTLRIVSYSVLLFLCLLYRLNDACSLHHSFIRRSASYGSLNTNIKLLLFTPAVKRTVWKRNSVTFFAYHVIHQEKGAIYLHRFFLFKWL